MKNTLLLGGVLALSMWATPTSAAVIYQNDFSLQPTLLTDDTNAYHWNEASGTLSMRLVQGPRTSINRYVALDTPLDPSRSFTLSWRQNMLVSSSTGQAPFGILPEGMVGASTTPSTHGGFIQPSIGIYQSRPNYQAFDVLTQDGRNDSSSGFGGFNFNAGGKWYQMTLAYDADVKRATYSVVDEVTGTTILLDARNGGTQGLIFGPEMHYIGSSMYAVAKSGTPTALVTSEYYADVLIDDIRLEQEVITPPEVATLTEPESAPSFGVPGTSFAWSAVYTHPDNHAPQTARVIVGSTTYDLMKATNATSTLGDGDYRNGEEYTFTLPLHARGATEAQFLFMTESGTLTTSAPSVRVGYSNVAFLPGILSSYLYKSQLGIDDQLWLPNVALGTDGDIEDLFFNEQGKSIRDDVYTKDGDVISAAYGAIPLYNDFIVHMDSMVASGTIAAWKPIAYDWRHSVEEVLNHGALQDGTVNFSQDGTYIIDQIRALASSSHNGRVTIVAHSNGGLLAKALLALLEENNDPLLSKIDVLVMVGVPQLGTPKSLITHLHGGENMLSGILLDDKTWREAARNSPGALTLLPSEKYPITSDRPLISFQPSLALLNETIRLRDQEGYQGGGIESVVDYRASYGAGIESSAELTDFLSGVARPTPAYEDVLHPGDIDSLLLGDVHALQRRLTNWQVPDKNADGIPDMRVIEIIGTGLPTISGVQYGAASHVHACNADCSTERSLKGAQAMPTYSVQGDGTVMAVSARNMESAEPYFFDLAKYNRERVAFGDGVAREHSNIVGARSIQNIVKQIISHETILDTYVSTTPAVGVDISLIEIHSPVELSVRDTEGNTAGYTFNAVLATRTIETTIPNALFERVRQSTFAVVPSSGRYTLSLQGLASSTFTMKVTTYHNDLAVSSTTFTDVPATSHLVATAVLPVGSASTTIAIDSNGDGVVDSVRKPDAPAKPTALAAFTILKTSVPSTMMSKRLKTSLTALLTLTEPLLKGKYPKLALAPLSLMKQLLEQGVRTRDISFSEARSIIEYINVVMSLIR